MAQSTDRPDPNDIIRSRKRSIPKLPILMLVLAGIGVAVFYSVRQWYVTDTVVRDVPSWERFTVERGDLTTTLTTAGTAALRKSAELSFGSGGIVTAVEVSLSEQVAKGAVLSRLEDRDAQNDLLRAKNNLIEAELRLSQLLEPPTEAVLLNADKAIASARSQLVSMELNLEKATDPPTSAEIAVADAEVAQAQSSFDRLMTPATDDEIAAADAAVTRDQEAVTAADGEVLPAYADLKIVQQSFCSLNQIQPNVLIDDGEALWEMSEASDITLSLDGNAFVSGAHSLKIEYPFREPKTIVAKKTLSPVDLSEFDHFEFWVRADTDTDHAYFQVAIYDSVVLHTPLEVLDIPALEGETWTHLSFLMTGLPNDKDVRAVAVRFSPALTVTSANTVLWIDEVRAVAHNPICYSTSLPLSEDFLNFLIGKVDETTSEEDGVTKRSRDFIQSNNRYVELLHAREVAAANLVSSLAKRAAVYDDPLEHEINQARAFLESAIRRRDELDDPISLSEVVQLETAIEAAESTLASVLADKTDILSGPSQNDIKIHELEITRAQMAVEQSQQTLDDMVLKAPFSGQIVAIHVSEGSRINAGTPAFQIADLDSVGMDLTVSETDFVGLKVGHLGVALFDAIPDQPFAIKLAGITSVPTITQGVVTYPVQADILTLGEAAKELPRLSSLVQGLGVPIGGAGIGTGIDIDALRRCAAQQVGREVSDPSSLSPGELIRIRENCLDGGTGPQRESSSENITSNLLEPVVGMNASVTVVVEVRQGVLLVPAKAIKSTETGNVVVVPGKSQGETEDLPVTIGSSDGERTEIKEGLVEGAVVLIRGVSNGASSGSMERDPDTSSSSGNSRQQSGIR